MKIFKKMKTLFIALVMLVSVFGGSVTAWADGASNDEMGLEAQRDGDTIIVKLVAMKDLSFGSMDIYLQGDDSVEYQSHTTPFDSAQYNQNLKFFSMARTETLNAHSGDALLTVVYKINDGFERDKDYSFSLNFEEICNEDFVDYASKDQTLSVTYREESVTPSYTVTFINNGVAYGTAQTVKENEKATKPTTDPTKTGSTFKFWSTAPNGTEYDFTTAVTGNLRLYAVYDTSETEVNKTADLSAVVVKNKVIAAAGVKVSDTFTYKFEAVTDNLYKTAGPAIADLTITANKADDYTKALGNITFEKGGVYKYKVTQANTSKQNWTYDDTVYYLYLTVEENAESKLVLTNTMVTTDANNADSSKKADLSFTNEYMPMTQLTVSNKVEGNPANTEKQFTYTITFTDPGVSGKVKINDPNANDATEIAYGAPYEFKLGNNDSITFDLPAGTKYTIVQNGEEYYTAKATVQAGSDEEDVSADYEANLTYTTGQAVELGDGEENEAAFTNVYSITPPTGIAVHREMLVIVALVIFAAAGSFVINRKLKRA